MLHTRTIVRSSRRLSLTLLLVLSTIRILAQAEIPQPAPEENEVAAAAKTSSNPSDQPTPLTKTQAIAKSSIANGRNKTAHTQSDKPKRGQLIITPIPISSPSVGPGSLAVGHVFKLNQKDKVLPPPTVGLVGAFTNSGSRAGGLGGRLYLSENKYQTCLLYKSPSPRDS